MMLNDAESANNFPVKSESQSNTETIAYTENLEENSYKESECESIPKRNPIPIDDIDILSDCKDYDDIPVIIELRYDLVKKLKENVKRKQTSSLIRYEMEEMIRHYNSNFGFKTPPLQALLFEEREPRKDVLFKLRSVACYLQSVDNYPCATVREIRREIKEALGNPDPRTVEKYLRCITKFVRLKQGEKRISGWYNLATLSEVIDDKIEAMLQRQHD